MKTGVNIRNILLILTGVLVFAGKAWGQVWIDPGVLSATYTPSLTLSNVTLPAGYAWGSPSTSLSAGSSQFPATFTDMFGTYSGNITVNVAHATGTFGSPAAINTTYSTTLTLSSLALPTGYTWNSPSTSLSVGNGQIFPATYTDPSGNYTSASGNIMVNVAQAGGTFPAHTPINTTYSTNLRLSSLSLSTGYAWSSPTTLLSAGNGQTFSATYTDPGGNFTPASGTITVNVALKTPTSADLNFTIIPSMVYDGSPKSISVTPASGVTGLGTITTYYTGISGTSYARSATPPTSSGTYSVEAGIALGTNYTAATISLGNFTITGILITFTGSVTASKVYDGNSNFTNAQIIIANPNSFSGIAPGDVVTLSKTGVTGTYGPNAGTGALTVSGSFSLSGANAANYTLSVQPTVTATISKKQISFTATANNKSYDGTNNATVNSSSVVFSGLVPGETITDGFFPAGTFTDTNVGNSKPVYITLIYTFVNYELPNGFFYITTANITKRNLTWNAGAVSSKTYDGAANATVTSQPTLNGVVVGDIVTVIPGSASFNTKDVGQNKTVAFTDYSISGANADNYTITGQPPNTMANITRKTITITGLSATNRNYNGETTVALTGGTLVGVESVDVGSVSPVLPAGLMNDANAGNNKPVTVAEITLAGTAAGNYMLTQPTGFTVTIFKAPPPTIVWPTANAVTYTSSLILSSVTVTGGSTDFGTFSWTTPATGLSAGTANQSMTLTLYPAILTNYDFSTSTVTGSVSVTVIKATPVVTLDFPTFDPAPKYGDGQFRIDSYAGSNLIGAPIKFRLVGDPPAVVDVNEFGWVTINQAGDAYIQAYVEETNNYSAGTSPTRLLTIAKANLLVTVENYRLREGLPFPDTYSLNYQGFINGDEEEVLNKDNMEFKLTQIGSTPTYTISVSGITADNYSIHPINGQLEITARPVLTATVDTVYRYYGDNNPPFIIRYTGFDPEDIMNYQIASAPSVTCNARIDSPPRGFNIRLSGGYDTKYDIQTIDSRLIIEPAILTVTADDQFRYEGRENPPLTFKYSGFKNDDTDTIFQPPPMPVTTANANTPPGRVPITFIEGGEDPRYEIRYVPGTLEIAPLRTIRPYGYDPFPIPVTSGVKFTIADVDISDPSIIDLDMVDEVLMATIKKTGSTTVTIRVTPSIYIPVEITKAPLRVWAKDTTRFQGTSNPEFKIRYEGFVYEENENVFQTPFKVESAAKSWDPPGTYDIWIVGGPDRSTINYEILSESGHYLEILHTTKLPTAFTPNGYLNQVWPWIESKYKVQIFNRLGTLLYEGDNGWDGKYKGSVVQPGVYFYFATSPDGVVHKGTVEVIRTR